MKLEWNDNAYNAVEKVISDKYPHGGNESIVVQLKQKYDFENEDEWEEVTTLLLNEGKDYLNPEFVWEFDWWEGQQDVELVAFAPVSFVKLTDEWKVVETK